jgi:DNA-directed RNA polymerase subunit H (RpoH/RPB5)
MDQDPITRAKITLEEMMQYRGYKGNNIFESEDDMIFMSRDETTFVSFQLEIGEVAFKNTFQTLLDKKKKIIEVVENAKVFIFVVRKCHPGVLDIIRKYTNNPKIFIQVFELRSLLFNVSKNILVPPHKRMIHQEDFDYNDFLKSLNISSLENIPKILINDPMAKFIGLREGELCKIQRKYSTTYRLCVVNQK